MTDTRKTASSAGHKLGLLIGDWFEQYFVLPLILKAGTGLKLLVDNRFLPRQVRGEKVVWRDGDGNSVDYDFVLELNGSQTQIGIPVGFIECFWRRGARHSKDKARDDAGKLVPMRNSYPTARFLGIVAAGEFTEPAREVIRGKDIDLFYVPKKKIVEAFSIHGLVMDYPDMETELSKSRIVEAFECNFTSEKRRLVAETLIRLVGPTDVVSYLDRVRAKLSATPQEIRLVLRQEYDPLVFRTLSEVTVFLEQVTPAFRLEGYQTSYLYQATYSDGTEFERVVDTLENLRILNTWIEMLSEHMKNVQSAT